MYEEVEERMSTVEAALAQFIVQTNRSLHVFQKEMKEFKDVIIPRFRQLFPEFDHLQLIPVFSNLRFEPAVIEYATQQGIFTMAYREWGYIDILNFEEITQ